MMKSQTYEVICPDPNHPGMVWVDTIPARPGEVVVVVEDCAVRPAPSPADALPDLTNWKCEPNRVPPRDTWEVIEAMRAEVV